MRHVVVRLVVRGVEAQHLQVLLNGLRHSLRPHQSVTQIVVGVREVWLEPQRLGVVPDALRKAPALEQSPGQKPRPA